MNDEVPFRIIVEEPMTGVTMKVQQGKDGLLEPSTSTPGRIIFDLHLRTDLSSGVPNFLGPFAQGPKGSRFIYLNSGKYAGQFDTFWARRAKLGLGSVTAEMVREILDNPGSRLETVLNGTGADGGPVCASVKGLVWKVSK
ncbi:MAG: DUF5990 family protein [Pyrinomonadaceae bacterium]